MIPIRILLPALITAMLTGVAAWPAAASCPNILFIIADDASQKLGQTYHCDWIKTPNIDRLAREGLVFDNAYVPTSKCAPTRAAILTGRNPWQLEAAGNHQSFFPAKFLAFGDALRKAGVDGGSAGKVWGPGIAEDAAGKKRDFGLPAARRGGKPGEQFAHFLQARRDRAPFFYWYGSADPHRSYEAGSGLAAGKRLTDIDRVPAYWPDNDTVRSDMLDYALEVERFDKQVGELLATLDAGGEAANTLVVVTSDHGMPFPRVKGHTYDDAHRVPLVMRWPAGIVHPGRRVSELVSAIDFAPTFLELFGIAAPETGMAPMTGHSLVDLLKNEAKTERPFVIIGRERNDVLARPGSEHGLGYPARGIRQGDFVFVHNFAPDRWPCGDVDLGLKDTDAGPTKALIEELGPGNEFWQHAFGKRPADQLFNIVKDPDSVRNLATDPAHAEIRDRLYQVLMTELRRQEDPRVLGRGDVFDEYPSVKRPMPSEVPDRRPVKTNPLGAPTKPASPRSADPH